VGKSPNAYPNDSGSADRQHNKSASGTGPKFYSSSRSAGGKWGADVSRSKTGPTKV